MFTCKTAKPLYQKRMKSVYIVNIPEENGLHIDRIPLESIFSTLRWWMSLNSSLSVCGGLAVLLLLDFLRFSLWSMAQISWKKIIFTLCFYATDVFNCLLTVVCQPVHNHHRMLQSCLVSWHHQF